MAVVRALLAERVWLLVLLIVLTLIVQGAIVPGFLNGYNLLNTLQYGVEIGLLAIAETLVIISGGGGIDLSVGSQVSLASIVLGVLVIRLHQDLWLSVAAVMLLGLWMGAVNGGMVAYVGIPPLLATLGTMYVYSSLALVLTGGIPVSGFPPEFFGIGQGTALGIPNQVLWIFLPVVVLLGLLAHRSVLGRHLFGVGANETAARFAGIDVRAVRFWVYVVAGFLAALGAVIMTSRVATAKPDAGLGYELRAITVAVLGGTDIFGGRGSVAGTVMAILLITLLSNGLDLAMVHPIWQVGMLGAVLIAGVLLNNWTAARQR
ncbi:MAG: ABC transporter permease [Limnochordaceae bacterium]|nr:ABC transporter permease [Limnochordaceae bacterium]